MKARYHIRNATHMVEADRTPEGLNALHLFRRDHSEFRGRRIKEVIQAYPEQITTLFVYELTQGTYK